MSTMECDHCYKEVIGNNGYVAWCRECINNDWRLLDNLGIQLPHGASRSQYNNQAFYWIASNHVATLVKSIPKITKKSLSVSVPDVEEICEALFQRDRESEKVASANLCKRDYYGIQCACPGCWGDIELDMCAPKIDFTLCKKRYYGIECDCGACPVPMKRR